MKPPRSRIEFELRIGAEDRESLAWRLDELADRIRNGRGSAYGEMGRMGLWGGAGSHGDYKFDEDTSIEPEQYRRDLQKWLDNRGDGA